MFSVAELVEAIKTFPTSKCPGPDGFGAEFYQAFHEILTPFLLRMINDSIARKTLPQSLYEANICLLLKKGKDPMDPANYRPISLLNLLQNTILQDCPFKIVQNYITYLGLKISKNPKLLLKLNLLEGIDKLKCNIEHWRTLPLSMIGRVNAIKMVSLPRFLYLFQNLPIWISADFFKKLETIILDFIWGYKKTQTI